MDSWRGKRIVVEEKNTSWLQKCIIGRIKDLLVVCEVHEAFIIEGYKNLTMMKMND